MKRHNRSIASIIGLVAAIGGCLCPVGGCAADGQSTVRGVIPFLGPFEWTEQHDGWHRTFDPEAWAEIRKLIRGEPKDGEQPADGTGESEAATTATDSPGG